MAYIVKYNLQTNIYIYIDYENAPSTKDDTKRINPYLFLHGLHSLFSTLKSDLIQ